MSVKTQLQEIYIGLLGRAADSAGLEYWTEQVEQGVITVEQVRANIVNEQPEYADGLGSMTRVQALNELYNNLFNRDADEEGLEYWVNGDGAGVNFDQLVLALINGAQPKDRLVLDNRTEVANYYSDNATSFSEGEAAAVLAGVDNTRDSVEAAKSMVDGGSYNSEIRLTDGEDILNGTRGDDLFTAKIIDNNNTLESGDEIYGGAGEDTLQADIGNSQNFAITPELNSVENVIIRAQASAVDGANDNNISDAVQIDAERSVGVNHWESNNSRSDLVIEDVRIRDDQLTKDITIAMVDTDAGNVDFAVYFDQLSLRKEGVTEVAPRELTLQLVDLIGAGNADGPLLNLPLTGFTIRLTDGTEIVLDGGDAVNNATTYTELVSALNDVLKDEGLDGTFEFSLGEDFTASGTAADGTVYRATEPQIQLEILDGSLDPEIGFASVPGTNTSTSGFRFDPNEVTAEFRYNEQIVGATDEIDPLITSTVILDNVGRGSMGGDLVIGGMSTGTTSVSKGVEQFDITVEQSSKLQKISSTNDTLQVVNIVNGTVKGDLTVTGEVEFDPFQEYSGKPALADDQGDQPIDGTEGDYRGFGFMNVRNINASEFEGKLDLNLVLDGNVVEKYMDLFDVDADPAADNIEFLYTLGTNDDDFFLALGSGNLVSPDLGTTTREDFDLLIEGGEGDDTIDTVIYDQPLFLGNEADGLVNLTTGDEADWYINSSENANLMIDAGAGDDTVSTHGSGNWIVDLGADDDTYYADNTGEKASWIVNGTAAGPVTFPAWDAPVALYKAYLTVTFTAANGATYSQEVEVPSTNYKTSLLQYNQAVKDAINNDDVLSKLLVAKDGPANTLVVEALIDGNTGLSMSLRAPTADELDSNEVAAFAQANNLPAGFTEASVIAAMQAQVDIINDNDPARVDLDDSGRNSEHVADNIITGGTGDDVLVLGTGEYSNDTVVYEGFGNGVDTIVNFDTDLNPQPVTVNSQDVIEEVVISFSDMTGSASSSIVFDNETIHLTLAIGTQGLIPAEDVAYQFATQYATAISPNWTAVWNQDNTVTLTSTAGPGDQTDLTAGDFNIIGATGTVSIDSITQGSVGYVAGTYEVMTVDFDTTVGTGSVATADGSFTFDGATINYSTGDGAITLAANVAAASYANWTAVDNHDGTVTFTAKDFGDVADADSIDIFNAVNGTDGLVVSTTSVDGTDATGTQTTIVTNGAEGLDYLDFSDYGVEAVYVDGVQVAGTAPNDADHLYVEMTEDANNAGEYLMEVYEAGADGVYGGGDDVLVGVIGTADFGQTEAFVAENFII